MFRRLDPRVQLLWWVGVSVLAMVFNTVQGTIGLILVMYLGWQTAGKVRRLVKFTLGLIPFLIVITIVSLFPAFDIERGIRMALRYYVLLGATMLIMATTNYGELTNAFRNLRHPRVRFFEKPLEVFSLIFGLAFLTVPMAAEEWARLKEVQRARGIDLTHGNKFQQVRRGLAMFPPLLLRILERIRLFSIAVIMYGYNPFQPRTLFCPLELSRMDKTVTSVILGATALGIILAFVFKL